MLGRIKRKNEMQVSLAECCSEVFAKRSLWRLNLLHQILRAYAAAPSVELAPADVLLRRPSLEFAALSPPAYPSDSVAVTDRERFMTMEELHGGVADPIFVRPYRAALMALYLLSGGAKGVAPVPYAECATRAELLNAENVSVRSVPHWAHRPECAVLDLCLDRQRPHARPSMKELLAALESLALAKQGNSSDASVAAFFNSFGATIVSSIKLVKYMLLESLVPHRPMRVGGLRGMNGEYLKCAVTAMLCLKQLGLSRDVAFLVIQWQIAMEPNPMQCIMVNESCDLTSAGSFKTVCRLLAFKLFSGGQVGIEQFGLFAKLSNWKRYIHAYWAFDLIRFFQLDGFVNAATMTFRLHIPQFIEAVSLTVEIHSAGDGTFNAPGRGSFISLFRALANALFQPRAVEPLPGSLCDIRKVGAGLLVGGLRVREILEHPIREVKYRISSASKSYICVVVKQAGRLFLVPAPEIAGVRTTFGTLRELIQFYKAELSWFQGWDGQSAAPPKFEWLAKMFLR